MGPIELLMHEHRQIEAVLSGLERFLGSGEVSGPNARAVLGDYAEFLRTFADRCHHGKEEDILFREMTRFGIPLEHGPIAVMLDEHETGRAMVRTLADLADGRGPLSDAERSTAGETGDRFVEFLRSHIQKEDLVLYPMAQRTMPPEAFDAMAERFEEFERTRVGKETHERMHALADALAEGASR